MQILFLLLFLFPANNLLASNLSRQLLVGSLIEKSCQDCPAIELGRNLQTIKGHDQLDKDFQLWKETNPKGKQINNWLENVVSIEKMQCLALVSLECQVHQNVISAIREDRLTDLLETLVSAPGVLDQDPSLMYITAWLLIKNNLYSKALILVYDRLEQDPFHPFLYEMIQGVFNHHQLSEGSVAIKGL